MSRIKRTSSSHIIAPSTDSGITTTTTTTNNNNNINKSQNNPPIYNPVLANEFKSSTLYDSINHKRYSKYAWKNISNNNNNNSTKIKRGKSLSNIKKETEDHHKSPTNRPQSSNLSTAHSQSELNTENRAIKKSFRRKMFSMFRFNVNKSDSPSLAQPSGAVNADKAIQTVPCELTRQDTLTNDTANSGVDTGLRNLSFTAAMTAKGVEQNFEKLPKTQEEMMNYSISTRWISDHASQQIPSSALRFWRHPSEEKIKASVRRICDGRPNVSPGQHSSSEMLEKSMLSLFSNDNNCTNISGNYGNCSNVGPNIATCCNNNNNNINNINNNNNNISSVNVPGYDRALDRYYALTGRREKTRSVVGYAGPMELSIIANGELRNCASSGNVHLLSSSCKVIGDKDSQFVSQHDLVTKTKMSTHKHLYTKRCATLGTGQVLPPPPVQSGHTPPMWRARSPPPYDKATANQQQQQQQQLLRRTARMSRSQNRLDSTFGMSGCKSPVPKPPPRSDSLIRSFELICKNITTSIAEPLGDSFKMFGSQSDYQAWLDKLPYSNPEKISSLLRHRSRISKRHCVSELIDDHLVSLMLRQDSNESDRESKPTLRRSKSWPQLKDDMLVAVPANSGNDNQSAHARRYNSLCKVIRHKQHKNSSQPSMEPVGTAAKLESPSLNKYSRLYNLRKTPRVPHKSINLTKEPVKNNNKKPTTTKTTTTTTTTSTTAAAAPNISISNSPVFSGSRSGTINTANMMTTGRKENYMDSMCYPTRPTLSPSSSSSKLMTASYHENLTYELM